MPADPLARVRRARKARDRAAAEYAAALVAAVDAQVAAGSRRPISDVADAAGVAPEVVRTNVRRARARSMS